MVVFDPIQARHHLHRTPELSNREYQTSAYVERALRSMGVTIVDAGLETGVIGEITGGSGPTVALRADLDGLPVTEDASHALRSQTQGVMHACGHDLHIASLLGAAAQLSERANELPGSVRLVFQPAEETGHGSDVILSSGVLDDVAAVIGFHNNPNYAPGSVAVGEAMMAGCVRFEVNLRAQGTHGGYPEKGTGPIEALATIVSALQTIVSRNVSAFDSAVLSVTEVHGGDVWNVIPTSAGFSGTVRTFSQATEDRVENRFRALVESLAAGFGLGVDITWERLARPLINNPELLHVLLPQVATVAHVADLQPSMAGEDFADYRAKAPLFFAFVGSNGQPGAADWHSPQYVGLDATIPTAISFYTHSAVAALRNFA